jgi:hypothetical protein
VDGRFNRSFPSNTIANYPILTAVVGSLDLGYMHRSTLRALVLVAALTVAFAAMAPAFAMTAGAHQTVDGAAVTPAQQFVPGDHDVKTVVLWTVAGTAAAAVVMGTLYTLKRRVGGFPRNPTWVAPITILRSADFPDDGTYGEAQAAEDVAHGHAGGH